MKKMLLWLMVPASALFLMMSKDGIAFLTGNQTVYFLMGLRLSDHRFIPNDWLTWKTFHYHFAFGYLVYFLNKLGGLATTTYFADLLLMSAMTYGLWVLCRKFCDYPILVYVPLITWLGIIGLHETELGQEYLFDGYLQPSEVSGCLMVLGFALLLEQRFLFSGIILGLAGLFHGAVLFSMFPALIATAYSAGAWKNTRSSLSFTVPLALCFGIFAVVIGAAMHASTASMNTLDIMTNLRAPGIMVSNWSFVWTMNWFLWIMMGLACMANLPLNTKYQDLQICFLTLLLTSVTAIAQALFIHIHFITAMMLWRSSPLALILGLLLIINQLILWLMGPQKINRRDVAIMVFMAVVCLLLASNKWGIHSPKRLLWLLSFPLAALSGLVIYDLKENKALFSKVAIAVLMSIMILDITRVAYHGFKLTRNYEKNPASRSLGEMEYWIRKNTPKNSIFVTPPDMSYMRVRARRAIVVDLKGTTYIPSELQEWYLRLCQEAGVRPKPLVKNQDVLINGYNHLSLSRALRLKKLYHASYVVVDSQKHLGNLNGLTVLFVNKDYKVLEIP